MLKSDFQHRLVDIVFSAELDSIYIIWYRPICRSNIAVPLLKRYRNGVFSLIFAKDPHSAIKLWCQVPFTKSKHNFSNWNVLYAVLFEKQYIISGTFSDKNRWIIKKVMVLKKLLPHLATRGTYSPGNYRCDEAWREQTLVYHPVMCQQRLIYCTWELNVMCSWPISIDIEWSTWRRRGIPSYRYSSDVGQYIGLHGIMLLISG